MCLIKYHDIQHEGSGDTAHLLLILAPDWGQLASFCPKIDPGTTG